MSEHQAACANPKCLNGANCPGHPWAEAELEQLRILEAGSRDMNEAAYKGAGFAQARRFFAIGRPDEGEQLWYVRGPGGQTVAWTKDGAEHYRSMGLEVSGPFVRAEAV